MTLFIRFATAGLDSVEHGIHQLDQMIDRFATDLDKRGLGTAITNIFKPLERFSLADTFANVGWNAIREGISSVSAGISTLIDGSIKAGEEFERLAAKAGTIFGPGAMQVGINAAKNFESAYGIAADEVLARMQRLKSAGFDPLNKTGSDILRSLSEAAQGLGTSFEQVFNPLNRIAVTGEVTQRSLVLLAQSGVPVAEILTEKFGLTAEQIKNIDKYSIDGKKFMVEFASALEERFGGALERTAKTSEGLWARIEDGIHDVLQLITSSEAWDAYLAQLDEVRKAIGRLAENEEFIDFARSVGTLSAEIITNIGRLAKDTIYGIQQVAGYVKPTIDWLADKIELLSGSYLEKQFKAEDMAAEMERRVAKRKSEGIIVGIPSGVPSGEPIFTLAKKERDRDFAETMQYLKRKIEEEKRIKAEKQHEELRMAKEYAEAERSAIRNKLRQTLDDYEEQFRERKRQLERQYQYENLIREQQYESERIGYTRKYEDEMRLLKRRQEDIARLRESESRASLTEVQKTISERERGIIRSGYTASDTMWRLMERAGIRTTGELYTPEGTKRLQDLLERERIERERNFEDEQIALKRQQEDEMRQREFLQKQNMLLLEQQQKAILENTSALKQFKAQIRHQLEIVDSSKFVESFIDQIFRETKIRVRMKQIPVAAP